MNRLEKKIVLLLLLVVTTVSAQIGVGTKTPHPDAMVEVKSTNKGLLLPRVALTSTASVAPLSAHIEGMSVYNTATTADVTPGYYYNDGAKWIRLVSGIVADASATATGKIQLAGDLSGTATVPTVPGLALKASLDSPKFTGKVGVGTTATTASAALEVESTTAGVLISRMTSVQRDDITSPANGLLIFNTSNNTFEVYKSTCNCWVGISDGGNAPASNVVNTAPSVNSLNYTGNFYPSQTITVNYSYVDAQNDPENGTTIQWQQASNAFGANATIIAGANSASYTIPSTVGSDVWIRALVTPRSSAGVRNGILTTTGFVKVDPSTSPSALSVSLSGTPTQGNTLTGTYTFTGGNGVESTNPNQPTLFNWQYATTNNGLGLGDANTYGPSFSRTYTPQSDLLGKYVRFGVRTLDGAGVQASNFVYSAWVGPIATASEQAPVVSNVTFTPTLAAVDFNLNSSYIFSDANGDPEGTSTYQWYRADDANGLNESAISGTTSRTYTTVTADATKYLAVEVTPVALTGSSPGTSVKIYNTTAIYPAATFTFTSSDIQQLPLFNQGRTMNSENSILVEVNVTVAGGISFTTSTVNGYSFSNSLVITTTGTQWITLNASGTLTSYSSAGDNFTITGIGSSTITKSINIKNTLTGAGATTAHGSASTTFSTNTTCTNNLISAGHTTGTCSGNVTVGSNSYGLVLINGQCWMQANLKEPSTTPCADAPNNGCNIWNNTAGVNNTWGFFNTTTTNGSSGWSTSESFTGRGLLYTYGAASNGNSNERTRGVCPQGFHIPSLCEYNYLFHGLGMSILDQNNVNSSTTGNVSIQLSTQVTSGTNSSGFTGLLSGDRNAGNGSFASTTMLRIWTSTSPSASNNTTIRIVNNNSGVAKNIDNHRTGASLRCIKD